jgi:hypothetical protein
MTGVARAFPLQDPQRLVEQVHPPLAVIELATALGISTARRGDLAFEHRDPCRVLVGYVEDRMRGSAMRVQTPVFTGVPSSRSTPENSTVTLPPHIKAIEEFGKLLTADRHRVSFDLARKDEPIAALEPLAAESYTVTMPANNVDPIAPAVHGNVKTAVQWVSAHRVAREALQPVIGLPHVCRLAIQVHPDLRLSEEHQPRAMLKINPASNSNRTSNRGSAERSAPRSMNSVVLRAKAPALATKA